MPGAAVHGVLEQAFPDDWRSRLPVFEERPVAAASIGQVHRGVWHDGTPVAVKLQYPGAGEALVADLGMLDRLAPLVRVAAPGLDARALFAELRERLADEVDYEREAAAQTAFAEAFRHDPDVYVPDVVARTDRVLVSRWVEGTPLSRVLTDGSEQERNRCGTLLVRLLLSSPARVGRLHGDPHPGNFRLLPDGRLGVLDFGSTEPLAAWPGRLGGLLTALRDRDAGGLRDVVVAAGLVRPDKTSATALLDLLDPYGEPLRSPAYRFTRAWLQEQTRRSSDPRSAAARTQRQLSIPTRHLLAQRVAFGLAGVLCSLGATVRVADEVERWVPGYAQA
jgi:predicted unusual protein kinase regulating ubiquinone biosynthesis (AarF/ABC1/UbiB family)